MLVHALNNSVEESIPFEMYINTVQVNRLLKINIQAISVLTSY